MSIMVEVKEEFTKYNISQREGEIFGNILSAFIQTKLYLHSPDIQRNPHILYQCVDLLWDFYVLLDAYIQKDEIKNKIQKKITRLYELADMYASELSETEDEDVNISEFYVSLMHLLRELLKIAFEVGLRMPMEYEIDYEKLLKGERNVAVR